MKMFGRIWGLNGSRNSKPSEDFAANLLPRMGFTKVRSLIPYRKSFPFDLAAEKDGRPAFVEVTTNRMHHNNKRFELAQDLGFDLYFLFLRPALDGYYLVHATESKFSYYIPYPVLRRREWNRID